MRVTFTELGPAGFRSAIDEFVAVYAAAMNPPERMLAGRDAILDRHAANHGFRAFAALLTGGDGDVRPAGGRPAPAAAGEPPGSAGGPGVLAGFDYGFHGVPGQWWHDMVASALAQAPGRASGSGWLENSFEVAELHVLPAYQGMGIGRGLLLRLTADRPERTAVLSTADSESRARRLYRGVGFTDLLTGFRFSGGEPPYAVMGARLPLADSAREAADARSPRSPSPSSW